MSKSKVSASQKALALLARREHSAFELRFKLLQKGFTEQETSLAIDEMLKAKYLDNDRYIGCLIRYRISLGVGPNKIKAELKSHEIPSHQITSHEEWKQTNWREVAIQAKQKRFGIEPATDPKQKAKQLQFLQRKGFSADDANCAVADVL